MHIRSHVNRYGLNIVANLLSDKLGDVEDLGVLDADFIAIVGANLIVWVSSFAQLIDYNWLTMPNLVPCRAMEFWIVALRLAWLRQLPHDW